MNDHESLVSLAESHLQWFCQAIPSRRVGSSGNRAATAYYAERMADLGFRIATPEFDCIDWIHGDVTLRIGGKQFPAQISPYSLGCHVAAPLAVVTTVAELHEAELKDQIVLLRGELAKEQLMPKNFVFYNPEEHQRIVALLEQKAPLAIIAATSRNPELAGGVYPFPLIEDGDFDIPSVFLTEEEGASLAALEGQQVVLRVEAARFPAKGNNVSASKGPLPGPKIVFCAHIDAKDNTPGALDNATGVIVLLLLGELLADYKGDLAVEMLAFNGEDYYSAPGQMQYLQDMASFADIQLAVNLDLAGYREGPTAYSLYGCPPNLASAVRDAFATRPQFVEGEQWYQSDHSVFVLNGKPAVAVTSECFMWLSTHITHTPKDVPALVDAGKLVHAAMALYDLLSALNTSP